MLFMARRTAPLTTHCPPLTDHCLLLTTYCLLTTDTASHACSLAPALPAASQRNCKSLMFRKHRWVGAKRRAAPDGALIDILGTDAHRRGGLCQVRGVEAGHGRAVTRIARRQTASGVMSGRPHACRSFYAGDFRRSSLTKIQVSCKGRGSHCAC